MLFPGLYSPYIVVCRDFLSACSINQRKKHTWSCAHEEQNRAGGHPRRRIRHAPAPVYGYEPQAHVPLRGKAVPRIPHRAGSLVRRRTGTAAAGLPAGENYRLFRRRLAPGRKDRIRYNAGRIRDRPASARGAPENGRGISPYVLRQLLPDRFSAPCAGGNAGAKQPREFRRGCMRRIAQSLRRISSLRRMAAIASITFSSKPCSRSSVTPSIVVPPGEQT